VYNQSDKHLMLSLEQNIFMKYSKIFKLNIGSNFQYELLYFKPTSLIAVKIKIRVTQRLQCNGITFVPYFLYRRKYI